MIHPLIGITTNPVHQDNGLPYDKLAHTYCESLRAAGGIPVILSAAVWTESCFPVEVILPPNAFTVSRVPLSAIFHRKEIALSSNWCN